MLQADLHTATKHSGGAEFDGNGAAPIRLGGVNGAQTFGAAPIDDGSGRDNLHASGAATDFIEWTQDTAETPSLVMHIDGAEGKFATGRVMTGNVSPVSDYTVSIDAGLFAA